MISLRRSDRIHPDWLARIAKVLRQVRRHRKPYTADLTPMQKIIIASMNSWAFRQKEDVEMQRKGG